MLRSGPPPSKSDRAPRRWDLAFRGSDDDGRTTPMAPKGGSWERWWRPPPRLKLAGLGLRAGALAFLFQQSLRSDCEPLSKDDDALKSARNRILKPWRSRPSSADERDADTAPPLISLKGGKVLSVRFPLRTGADVPAILVESIEALASKSKTPWVVEPFNSPVAKQLSFQPAAPSRGGLRMVLFTPVAGYGAKEVEFIKESDGGHLSDREVKVILNALALSGEGAAQVRGGRRDRERIGKRGPAPREPSPSPPAEAVSAENAAEEELASLGARVHGPRGDGSGERGLRLLREGKFDELWGTIAGYEPQKRQIEDSLLLNLLDPSTLNRISAGTREHLQASGLPKAVLFDGPPGTGKTSTARALASMAVVPLVYVPIESITSKYYGESEKILSRIFALSSQFEGGCILFLDEIDALVTTREQDMHDASRRILGVLLKEIDGFEASNVVVIAATNRKRDLDPALLSRFEFGVTFGLPDEQCRGKILEKYAKHLKREENSHLASLTAGFAGRDLVLLCVQAERRWASKIVRREVREWSLPPLQAYADAVRQRTESK